MVIRTWSPRRNAFETHRANILAESGGECEEDVDGGVNFLFTRLRCDANPIAIAGLAGLRIEGQTKRWWACRRVGEELSLWFVPTCLRRK